MEKRIKLDGSVKYYKSNEKTPVGVTMAMMFVYENAAGEKIASNVCDFGLIEMGYEQTGDYVLVP